MVLSAIVVKQKGDKGLEKLRSELAPLVGINIILRISCGIYYVLKI